MSKQLIRKHRNLYRTQRILVHVKYMFDNTSVNLIYTFLCLNYFNTNLENTIRTLLHKWTCPRGPFLIGGRGLPSTSYTNGSVCKKVFE